AFALINHIRIPWLCHQPPTHGGGGVRDSRSHLLEVATPPPRVHRRRRPTMAVYARKVEDLGYSTLVMGDHFSIGGLGPLAAHMAAADATTTLRLGSMVFA